MSPIRFVPPRTAALGAVILTLTLGCTLSRAQSLPEGQPQFVNCRADPVEPTTDDVRIAAVGDLVFTENSQINRRAFNDFLPLLSSADLVLGNLEGAITTHDKPRKAYVPGRSYAFRFPVDTAEVLKRANFHVLSIANNHANDYGPIGFADTLQLLKAAGLESTGLKGSFVIRSVKGLKVGVIALAHYPVYNNVLEIEATARLVSEVRSQSDVVVLFYQLGGEGDAHALLGNDDVVFLGEQRGNARRFAAAMVQAGAGALIGHGPHVVRAAECIQGVPVLHSIGNFVSSGGLSVRSLANVAVMAEVLVDGQGHVKGVRATPATFDKERLPMIDASGRALHLINWFNLQASRTLPGFEPLNFPAAPEQQEGFRKWLRSTPFGAKLPAQD
jgi:poly-gamma-glutamate capsule biosynthesis protein CapA/YwtB (metallophosphatase superfamily)